MLAARSLFFKKLFSNRMRESNQKIVTLRVNASDEAAFMDLLYFIYSNTLKTHTHAGLLDVLTVSDKYQVASCVRHCCRLVQNFPMTKDSALLYLDFPSGNIVDGPFGPLVDAAKTFIALQFKDITKYKEEVMNLPLAGIVALLSSDSLQIDSEDAVYYFALKWASKHYPNLEERRKIFGNHLCHVIQFPFMTCGELKKVTTCREMDSTIALKLVLGELLQHAHCIFCVPHQTRVYKIKPLKVVQLTGPHKQCVVYLDLQKDECQALFPSRRLYSLPFSSACHRFALWVDCNTEQGLHYFDLFLGMRVTGSQISSVDYEFSVRQQPTGDFVSKSKGHIFTGQNAMGAKKLLRTPWTFLMEEDSQVIINGYLHIRVELTIKQ